MTVTVFLLCFAAGITTGCVNGTLSFFRKRLNIAFTVVSDSILAALSVFAHAVIMYALCDGIFFPYAAIAQVLGFFVAGNAVKSVTNKIAVCFSKRKKALTKLQ